MEVEVRGWDGGNDIVSQWLSHRPLVLDSYKLKRRLMFLCLVASTPAFTFVCYYLYYYY